MKDPQVPFQDLSPGGPLRPAHCEHRFCESQGLLGIEPLLDHCGHHLSVHSLLSLFSPGHFQASPSPPNVRVARGEGQPPRASARGPARGGGHNLLDFILVEVAGGNPKVDLNGLRGQVRCRPPFLCSTPERGLITAPLVPGTSYPIAGVWGARIWCSAPRGVCTALRPRALVRQALQRPCIELPAAGALIHHPSLISPTRAPAVLLGEHPSLPFQGLPQ